jgi:hypothetical protein
MVFWILQEPSLKELQRRKEKEQYKYIETFISFPQLIITSLQMLEFVQSKRAGLAKLLGFQQQVVVLTSPSDKLPDLGHKEEPDKYKVSFLRGLDMASLKPLVLLTLKKNSVRCFQESLKINMQLLESLNLASTFLGKERCDLSSEECLAEVLQVAASTYLSEEVERQYESLWQSMTNAPPRN